MSKSKIFPELSMTLNDITLFEKTPSLKELKQIHEMKTGALITAAILIPAILCNATETQKNALSKFGHHLGLLFQITDDILDVTASQHQLGKTPQKDIKQNKTTYVTLLGLDEAQKFATKESENAINTIKPFNNKESLIELVHYIKQRTH